MSRAKAYCFTLNNYTSEQEQLLQSHDCVYMLYGREIAKTGTPHLQGYIQYQFGKTFTAVKRNIGIPQLHLETAKGNYQQNYDYCTKEDNNPFIKGTPKIQGKRNDLATVRDLIQEGASMRDIIPVATSIQSIRMAEITLKYFEQKRNWKPEVKWFYGPTGTGKTYQAYQELEDPFTTLGTGQWWEGYDGHEHVIIDDMRADFMKFHNLLKLLHGYPHVVENKGGSRQFLAKKIIITSCYHPEEMYKTREDIAQLLRRIDKIQEFSELII